MMDFHSLALGIDAQRRRFARAPADWAHWAACADVLQMNESEARCWRRADGRRGDGVAVGRACCLWAPALLVTRGARGSWTVSRGTTGL